MKIGTIVGARPQFIKAATISRVIQSTAGVSEIIIHTGQHYDHNVSGVFFSEMGIRSPDFDLGVGSGAHGEQTGKMLAAIEQVLLSERPAVVLVYGDTNSTLAGALASAKLDIPVAHVEAGLRSFNRKMPEEINRVLTDHVSDVLFAPTDRAMRNLEDEGIAGSKVVRTGDVMFDAALFYATRAEQKSRILNDLQLAGQDFVLATIHRAENTGEIGRLRSILSALAAIHDDLPVVLPLHPRTRAVVAHHPDLAGKLEKLHLLEPIGYFDMITLERHARLIMTDSGGVQKEASFHNVRCVTLRGETEWEELIVLGRNALAPPELGAEAIVTAARNALALPPLENASIYGTGRSAEAIVQELVTRYGEPAREQLPQIEN
jgi:UDP-GlcNAc3NAcA epimerase